jgi:hypothetical protein
MNMEVREERRVARSKSQLAERLEDVRQRIASAAAQARRDPAEISLVAVTKGAAPEQIRDLLSLGVADLGENRVQQLQQRAAQLNEFLARRQKGGEADGMPSKIRWHMIGHLQRNKVKALLPVVSVIHSVDSLRLAEELDAAALKLQRRQPVLMQVNASEEAQKSGVAIGAAVHLAEQIDSMPNLQLVGLMTMAEFTEDSTQIRRAFARTREVFEEMKWHKIGGASFRHLSMGMSHDFEIGIAEGATLLRIGSALFGGKPDTVEEKEE